MGWLYQKYTGSMHGRLVYNEPLQPRVLRTRSLSQNSFFKKTTSLIPQFGFNTLRNLRLGKLNGWYSVRTHNGQMCLCF